MSFTHSQLPAENRLFLLEEAAEGTEGYAWQQALQADRQGFLYIESGAVVRPVAMLLEKATLKIRRVKEGVEVFLSTVEGTRKFGHINKMNYLPVMLIRDPDPEPTLLDAIHADEAKRHQAALETAIVTKRKPGRKPKVK